MLVTAGRDRCDISVWTVQYSVLSVFDRGMFVLLPGRVEGVPVPFTGAEWVRSHLCTSRRTRGNLFTHFLFLYHTVLYSLSDWLTTQYKTYCHV